MQLKAIFEKVHFKAPVSTKEKETLQFQEMAVLVLRLLLEQQQVPHKHGGLKFKAGSLKFKAGSLKFKAGSLKIGLLSLI